MAFFTPWINNGIPDSCSSERVDSPRRERSRSNVVDMSTPTALLCGYRLKKKIQNNLQS